MIGNLLAGLHLWYCLGVVAWLGCFWQVRRRLSCLATGGIYWGQQSAFWLGLARIACALGLVLYIIDSRMYSCKIQRSFPISVSPGPSRCVSGYSLRVYTYGLVSVR